MNKVYKKPQMKFVSLFNEERIAANGNCWSKNANGDNPDLTWIYDLDQNISNGYVEFTTPNANCGTDNVENITYVPHGANGDVEVEELKKLIKSTIEGSSKEYDIKQLFGSKEFSTSL